MKQGASKNHNLSDFIISLLLLYRWKEKIMKTFKVYSFRTLLIGASFAVVNSVHAVTLFSDDFNDTNLNSAWEIQRGHATMDNGWVRLQGSTPGSRDAFIMTHEGDPTWSNYELTTRFNPLGGGDDWYNAQIQFRVQDMHGWGEGTYYRLFIYTPNAAPGFPPDSIGFGKVVDGIQIFGVSRPLAQGILNGIDNTVNIRAVGGDFDIIINGTTAAHFHDENPIPTGGIALGAIWESTTRYDYVNVTAIPEPETYAMLLAGLGLLGFMARRRKGVAV